MLYLTIVVFLGVIVVAFNKELMILAQKIWKKDIYRNTVLFLALTLAVHFHAEKIGGFCFEVSKLLSQFVNMLFHGSAHFELKTKIIYILYLILCPSVLASIVFAVGKVAKRQQSVYTFEILWFCWLCNVFVIGYLT